MIQNYLKVAIRNFLKHKLYVLINVIGLGFGIGCSIVAFVNWQYDHQFDIIHLKGENIYKVNSMIKVEDGSVEYSTSPLALRSGVDSKFSGIRATSTVMVKSEVFKQKDEVWFRKVGYVSEPFFDMFTFKTLQGSLKSFNSPATVIITESTATKYFTTDDVIGQQMQLSASDGQLYDFTVGAVVADPPSNSSFLMDMYIPIAQMEQIHQLSLDDWAVIGHAFFIQADPEITTETILEQLNPLANLLNEKREDWFIEEFKLIPFYNMAHQASKTRGNYLSQANPTGSVMLPTIMAIFILLIGCFNFTNTSIALAEKRLKEIGVRKALGGQRSQLIFQIIAENALLCVFALFLGLFLAEILVPAYNQMGPWVDNTLAYIGNLPLVGFLVVLLILVVFVSSAYPAFYVSKFDATHILKGTVRFKNSNWLTKMLIVLQLSISLSTLIQGGAYLENAIYQNDFDYGFDKEGIITVPVKDGQAYHQLHQELVQNPNIKSIAGSTDHIGMGYTRSTMELASIKKEVNVYRVGDNYFQTNGLTLDTGRFFHKSLADIDNGVVVNEALVKEWMISNPIGKQVRVDEKQYNIIGVVKDFYAQGLWIGQYPKPALFRLDKEDTFKYLTAKVNATSILAVNDEVKSHWTKLFPYQPYEGAVENEAIFLNKLLNKNMVWLNIIMSGMALLLSGIGLYNMVSLNVLKQRKAVGIRKVLGASNYHILINLSKTTILLLAISLLLGSFKGYFLTGMVLDLMYAFHSLPSVWTIAGASLFVLVVLVGVIAYKVYQEARSNPVEALRYE